MKPWPDPRDTEKPVSKAEIVIAAALTLASVAPYLLLERKRATTDYADYTDFSEASL